MARPRIPGEWPPFWANVEKVPSGCWEWRGKTLRKGYGQLRVDGVHQLAHRYSFVLAYGPIPPRAMVLHRCDNPPCVNPKHLRLGTASDNALDYFARRKTAPTPRATPRKVEEAEPEAAWPGDSERAMAEREGFEPSWAVTPGRFSKPPSRARHRHPERGRTHARRLNDYPANYTAP